MRTKEEIRTLLRRLDGRPIGIEIISPREVSVEEVNRALASVNVPPVASEDLAPLAAG